MKTIKSLKASEALRITEKAKKMQINYAIKYILNSIREKAEIGGTKISIIYGYDRVFYTESDLNILEKLGYKVVDRIVLGSMTVGNRYLEIDWSNNE